MHTQAGVRQGESACSQATIALLPASGLPFQELAKEDNHALEGALGFPLFTEGEDRLGWLMNLNAVSLFWAILAPIMQPFGPAEKLTLTHSCAADHHGEQRHWAACERSQLLLHVPGELSTLY